MTDTSKRPTTAELKHPIQPIGWDENGVIRFKRNAIVDYLLEECLMLGGTDLNQIHIDVQTGRFSVEDQIQLMQLIGYSVSGFGDLSYAPADMVEMADNEAEKIIDAN